MQPTRAWLVMGPAVLAGVLAGHELAYRITGTTEGAAHDYLSHAPQILLVLLAVGIATVRVGARIRLPAAWQLSAAALATFVIQEHVERLVHTGSLPWLLTTPAFLVGLAAQLPLALLAWLLTRGVLDALEPLARGRTARSLRMLVRLVVPESRVLPLIIGPPLPGRGPPVRSGL